MAENTDEEHLDIPITSQSENLTGEITPTTDTETINPNQETENMEVHHHPDLHHKPKKWKEYFLEFLMIFLAVTLGFFAESYREHLVNRSKEREYIYQLISDLKEDIQECNKSKSVISINTNIGYFCDSLINILSKNNPSRVEVILAYYLYNEVMLDWYTAYFKDATWSQLRNNGGLSNIHNQNVVRKVNDYYKWASVINDYKDEIKERYSAINYNEGRKVFDQRMEKIMLDSIDSKQLLSYGCPSDSLTQFVNNTENIQFIHHDAETILGLCNDLRSYKSLLALLSGMLNGQRMRAERLVEMITIEYSLKD